MRRAHLGTRHPLALEYWADSKFKVTITHRYSGYGTVIETLVLKTCHQCGRLPSQVSETDDLGYTNVAQHQLWLFEASDHFGGSNRRGLPLPLRANSSPRQVY